MKVINLFGGPGIGKSVTAAEVFAALKKEHKNAELATEYVKKLVWADRHKQIRDQLYLFAKQNHKLEMLRDVCDYVVTDSPLLLPIIYQPDEYYSSFSYLAEQIFNSYNNINVVLKRNPNVPYQNEGRMHDREEAHKIDELIELLLNTTNVDYHTVLSGDPYTVDEIVELILTS